MFWQYPLMLQHKFTRDPVISLLGVYPREGTAYVHQLICVKMFMASLFKIANFGKFKCSVARKWINNSWDIHTMKYHAGTTKNK